MPEKCPYCGEEFEKLSSHINHCKKKYVDNSDPEFIELFGPDNTNPEKSIKPRRNLLSNIFSKKQDKSRDKKELPSNLLTMDQKLAELDKIKSLSPEEKFKRFFFELEPWSINEPKTSIFSKIKHIFSHSDVEYRKCVFVSENVDAKCGCYPYDPKDKYLFLPNGVIYDIPQSGNIWFFNVDKFLPLINSKDPSDIYDLPIHYATAVHNDGVQYGQSMAFNDLVSSITSLNILLKIAFAVTVISVIGAVLIVKTTSDDVSDLIIEIQSMKSILVGGV